MVKILNKEHTIMYVIIGEKSKKWEMPEDASPEDKEFFLEFYVDERGEYSPPEYDTDPRRYNLPVFNEKVSDDEFELEYREKVRAFFKKEDAFKFASYCNMVTVKCPVYIKNGESWEYSKDHTSQMADDLS